MKERWEESIISRQNNKTQKQSRYAKYMREDQTEAPGSSNNSSTRLEKVVELEVSWRCMFIAPSASRRSRAVEVVVIVLDIFSSFFNARRAVGKKRGWLVGRLVGRCIHKDDRWCDTFERIAGSSIINTSRPIG